MPNWLSLIKAVPWTDVISSAPAVADGARKLWKNVAAKVEGAVEAPPAAAAPAATSNPGTEAVPPQAEPLATQAQLDHLAAHLGAQLALAEAHGAELRAQLAQSTELLHRLADQNGQLAQGLESLAARLRWAWAVALLALAAGAAALGAWALR